MKTILRAQVLNPYRSKVPKGFYSALKGHTGTDLNYKYEDLPSPITGKVLRVAQGATKQIEMGNVLYIEDAYGNVHVFAHLDKIFKELGDKVTRGEIIAKTGNSGSRTTSPHLHYEIVTGKPINLIDRIMTRKELPFKGYNTDPLLYLKNLYFKYNVDLDGKDIKTI